MRFLNLLNLVKYRKYVLAMYRVEKQKTLDHAILLLRAIQKPIIVKRHKKRSWWKSLLRIKQEESEFFHISFECRPFVFCVVWKIVDQRARQLKFLDATDIIAYLQSIDLPFAYVLAGGSRKPQTFIFGNEKDRFKQQPKAMIDELADSSFHLFKLLTPDRLTEIKLIFQ